MSIEQTNQLILLILNSVLMSLLSAMLLGGAWLRQNSLSQQLHQVQRRYRQMTHQTALNFAIASVTGSDSPEQTPDRTAGVPQTIHQAVNQAQAKADLKKVRDRRQQLSTQYRWSHIGMLTLHSVLMIFGVSLFTLALRSLLAIDLLISAALFLFALGAGGLLAGTGCILMDLAQGNSGGDSIGQALGKAMIELTHWWKSQGRQTFVGKPWAKPTMAMLMPAKSSSGQGRPIPRKAGR
ncbi:MAG: hypothetical protein AAGC93_14555 [Cyanobacteria bacterium P01_F01_bin.53]